ncbi:DUF2163 domain-containing protein [Devosia sp.]|uniref:DUF2163 domain-containing protein n=1 Tax=Devosia sp. TaxID=1871048 RepID=UPI003A8F90C4
MRTLDPGFAAHIASGATTLATCWRIARTDGVVLGFTDHDRQLEFGGTDYLPAHGLDGSETPARLGAATATAEVAGVLTSEAISAADIELGRYDGAAVETWRVNWRAPEQRLLLSRATIGEIISEDGMFRAELRSGQHRLNQPKGRLYQALCDAELGDARCGVDLLAPERRAEATVAAVRDRFRLAVTGLESFAAGDFGFGVASWSDGQRAGLKDRIVGHDRLGGVDLLRFAAPVGDWVTVGAALVATVGCDRRFATCRSRFANAENFRGFPHIPGSDFVLRYPRDGMVLDGRKLVG